MLKGNEDGDPLVSKPLWRNRVGEVLDRRRTRGVEGGAGGELRTVPELGGDLEGGADVDSMWEELAAQLGEHPRRKWLRSGAALGTEEVLPQDAVPWDVQE